MANSDFVTRILLENQQFRTQIADCRREIRDLRSGARSSSISIDGLRGSLIGMASKVAAPLAIATAVKEIGTKAIEARGKIEALEVSFSTLLRSTEKANQLVSQLKDYGNVTPYDTEGLSRAAQTMLSFGISYEKVMPTLKQLGDVAMGSQDKLSRLTLAFSQMSAAGRVTKEDLNQMVDAGFNPLQVISQQTGESIGTLFDKVSKGQVSVQQIANAFADATKEGGQFHNMALNMSDTVEGKMSTMQDAIDGAYQSIGKFIEPVVKSGIDLLTNGVEALTKEIDDFGKVSKSSGNELNEWLKIVKSAIPFGNSFNKVLNSANAAKAINAFRQYGTALGVLKLQMQAMIKVAKSLRQAMFGDNAETFMNKRFSGNAGGYVKVKGKQGAFKEGQVISSYQQTTKSGKRQQVTKRLGKDKNGKAKIIVTITDLPNAPKLEVGNKKTGNKKTGNKTTGNTHETIGNTHETIDPIAPKGSLADLDNKISKKKQELSFAVKPEDLVRINEELDTLTSQKRYIELYMKEGGKSIQDQVNGSIVDAKVDVSANDLNSLHAKWQQAIEASDEYQAKLREIQEQDRKELLSRQVDAVVDGMSQLSNSASYLSNLGESFNNCSNALDYFSAAINTVVEGFQVYKGVVEAVNTLNELFASTSTAAASADTAATSQEVANSSAKTAASSGEAIAGATASGAKMPFPLNLVAIAAGVAAVIAALATISGSFADGGIIQGANTHGDQLLARVNAGEMILNGSQQARLFNLLDGGTGSNMSGQVEFKISGSALKGVLRNYDNKMSVL